MSAVFDPLPRAPAAVIPSTAVRWPWFALLLTLFAVPPAHAVDLDEAAILEPEVLAEQLGISGTAEAVVLVVADQDLDLLVLGLREVVLAPLKDGSRFVRLVRGQVDGILPLRVERGDLLWEGEMRTLAGHVSVFDAGAALASPEARGLARDRALRGFDLFGFYRELDALPTTADRRARCESGIESLPQGPDRALLRQACANVDAMTGAPAPAPFDEPAEIEDEDVDEALARVPTLAPPPSTLRDPVFYRRDGLTRAVPRGTAPRLLVAAGGFAFTAGFTVRAFELELDAERSYVRYREAERVGDDLLVSRHLYNAQAFDRHRDAGIGVASVGLVTSLTMLIWQAVEHRRFGAGHPPAPVAVGVAPLRDGIALGLSMELDR